jgi:hypothetical protein
MVVLSLFNNLRAMHALPARSGARWKAAGIVLGAAFLGLAVLGGFLVVGMWRGWPSRVTPSDREVLVVAAELAPLFDFVLRSDAEAISKTSFLGGRTELEYDYAQPDPTSPFQLHSRVIVASDRAAARSLYQQLASQLGAGASVDLAWIERQGSFSWGDASRYGVFLDDGKVVGQRLACRRGEKVFYLELSGIGLDDSQFTELVAASLQSLESYSP